MTRSTRKRLVIGAAVVSLTVAFAISLLTPADDNSQAVEIQEYEGEKLGSVDDFRENSIAGIQTVDINSYRLSIDGLVEQSASYTYGELLEMPHHEKLVTIHCVEGWSVQALWKGIPLPDLLTRSGISAQADTVIFHAYDGYTTSLPIEFVLERNLIIADEINGLTLPPAHGFPFQLVAEDKWGYKWIRWITRIELSEDPDYRGFWERRGYSNEGNTDGSFFSDER